MTNITPNVVNTVDICRGKSNYIPCYPSINRAHNHESIALRILSRGSVINWSNWIDGFKNFIQPYPVQGLLQRIRAVFLKTILLPLPQFRPMLCCQRWSDSKSGKGRVKLFPLSYVYLIQNQRNLVSHVPILTRNLVLLSNFFL